MYTMNSQSQDAVVKIRNRYNDFQAAQKAKQSDDIPQSVVTMTIKRNLPGSGPQIVTQKIYFGDDYDYEEDKLILDVEFVSLSYNYAARNYYEEYLYDDNNNLIFAYARYPFEDLDGDMIEARVYYENNNIIKVLMKRKTDKDKQYTQFYSDRKVPSKYKSKIDDLTETGKRNISFMNEIYRNLK